MQADQGQQAGDRVGTTDLDLSVAGLLHDVGKLGQRAYDIDEGLSQQSLGMKELVCPSAESGYRTHLHVLYTNEFFNQVESALPEGVDRSRTIELAVFHHRPGSHDQNLLADADRLASAVERTESPSSAKPASKGFRRTRLYPLAADVCFDPDGPGDPADAGHSVKAWEWDSDVLMPVGGRVGELQAEYLDLWTALIDRFQQNQVRDPRLWIARALSDLEAFTWCVPAATNTFPDISLFDHSRAVAAIASCLQRSAGSDQPFLLVTGDFKGIQKYIFTLKHESEEGGRQKGMAKILRARSFNVRLFTEQVVFRILREAGLPLTQRILSAGGKLYLLLPNDPRSIAALEQTAQTLAEWSLRETDGRLRFNLAWLSLDRGNMHHFADALAQVNQALAEEASRPLHRALIQGGWNPDAFVGDEVRLENPRDEDDRELGQRLPNASGVAFDAAHRDGFFPFGEFRTVSGSTVETHPEELLLYWDEILTRNTTGLSRSRFSFHVPRDQHDELLTFEEIAEAATGRNALGFVKADIDNLGMIFSRGLRSREGGDGRVSISRVATLSRALEGFFGHHVNKLVADRFPQVYLIFSGGDDLVAVGPWNQAIDFIVTLREELGRYVAGNKTWGLSAGILVAHSHTPVLTAIEQAETLIEHSKAQPGKDHLTLFGETVSWETARQAIKDGDRMYRWLSAATIRTGQIRRLLTYAGMFNEFQRTGNTEHLRYIYLLIYDLKRNWDEKSQQQRDALAWAQRLTDPSFTGMAALNLSCTYALYMVRSSDKE